MHTREEDPVALMQEHGVKPTANRILILRALLGAGRPLSMTEIETVLESVDKSIISRTLSVFREARLLHVLADGSESIRYEVCHCAAEEEDSDRHVHFHCTSCGRTFCLQELPVPSVTLPEGYLAHHVNFIVEGICPDCL
ncbi:MAG: transcriptional repressor [Bacteroidales bacterium]|jgi:Fur family ferric uptake transcriptional regulator|nr:transcriptional repressor [Bacteroidales bacterium]